MKAKNIPVAHQKATPIIRILREHGNEYTIQGKKYYYLPLIFMDEGDDYVVLEIANDKKANARVGKILGKILGQKLMDIKHL